MHEKNKLEFSQKQISILSELGLYVLAIVTLMSKAWESTLQAMDSSIHARLALEVTRNGLIPSLPMPNFNDHPFTLFYLVGQFMRWVGAEAWSARFIPSLFGVLCVVMVVKLGKRFFSERVGFFAGLFLLFTPLFIQFSARFQLDPAMIFFMVLSFYAWMSGKPVLAGLASGVAVMMKSPVGFLLLPSVVISEVFLARNISLNKIRSIAVCLIAALIPPLALWALADLISHEHLSADYFGRQVLGTAVEGRNGAQVFEPFYFFGTVLSQNRMWKWLLALTVFTMVLLRHKRIKWWNPELRLIAVASLIMIFVISCMKFKFPHYFLPAFPFLALMTARINDLFFVYIENAIRRMVLGLAVVAPLVLLVFPLKTAPEMFPALRKFAAFIQSEGVRSDRVLFIVHEQPYGSVGDYFVELSFYADRKFLSSPCGDANQFMAKTLPEWIITSGKSPRDCVSDEQLKAFPFQIKLGNQFLLGRKVAASSVVDLTPLYRELKAPIDGVSSSLPQDLPFRY